MMILGPSINKNILFSGGNDLQIQNYVDSIYELESIKIHCYRPRT